MGEKVVYVFGTVSIQPLLGGQHSATFDHFSENNTGFLPA